MSSESLFPNVPSQWEVTTLGELAKASGGDIQTGPFGSQLHAGDYVDDGIPSIMPKNISVDAVTTDDIARVSTEDVERLSKYKVEVGDIVYSRRGDIEKCARITEKEDGWLCGTGCLRVRVKSQSVSTEYLHAYLCHPTVREWIVRHAVGATMPNLNTSILSALPVVIPSDEEMAIIASIWLSISDKIQLNHQINQTLEQMAQAIFKSWFVDFEPIKAKIAALEAGGSEEDALLAAMQAISGRGEAELTRLQAEQPEQYAELRATAELFPSAMQDSELGEIPEGWLLSRIEDLSEKVAMGPFGSNIKVATFVESGIPVISGQHLKETLLTDGDNNFITPEHADKLKNSNVFPGDIIFTHAGTIGQVSLIPQESKYRRYVISQRQFYLRADKQKVSPIFLVYFFRSSQGQHLLLSNASQVGVPSIARPSSHLKSIELVVPPLELMQSFERTSQSLLSMTASLRFESIQLCDLRDTLLPR